MPDHPARAAVLPALIADDAALDRYLGEFQRTAYAMQRTQAGISMADWLADRVLGGKILLRRQAYGPNSTR